MVASPRAALWNEGQGPPHHLGRGPVRRTAAAPVALRARSRCAPRSSLLDEPTSALDPISTLKVEELIDELKHDFTIVIVTHNMQQAARCADRVAFFYLGEMVEISSAADIFTNPREKRTQEYVTDRPVQLSGRGEQQHMSDANGSHIVKSYEQQLTKLRDMMVEMGGIVENEVALAAAAVLPKGQRRRHPTRWRKIPGSTPANATSNSSSYACSHCVSRLPATCARSWRL